LTYYVSLPVNNWALSFAPPHRVKTPAAEGTHLVDKAVLLFIQESTADKDTIKLAMPILSQTTVNLFDRLPVPPLNILSYYQPFQSCGAHTADIYTTRGTTLFTDSLFLERLY
jgi:hypothetical protein